MSAITAAAMTVSGWFDSGLPCSRSDLVDESLAATYGCGPGESASADAHYV
jgi:hypothetical protein